MTQIVDCVVNYFGLDENDRPGYRRYFCYHILAGPGPTNGAGVAWVETLAIHDESERCTWCQNMHTVEAGGPAAALAAAVRYLDTYHQQDRVWKVQSDIRGLPGDPATDALLSPVARFPVSAGRGISARKE
jgi:hypothetical protein